MIKGLLLDIAGVLEQDGRAINGAVDAVKQLRRRGYSLRFVTNTSRRCRADLCRDLQSYGFELQATDVFTAPLAIRGYLERESLTPLLLADPALAPDFEGLPKCGDIAVVVCDAGRDFNYENLNLAFQAVVAGAQLLAVGDNRYFRADGMLWLDAGPFVRAIEYAAGVEARVLGKPAPDFFLAATAGMGCRPEQALMVGDDVTADVLGAMAAGLHACLVRTGKFRSGDEARLSGSSALVYNDLSHLVQAHL